MDIWPGEPSPLGATFDGVGTNFSIFSEIAERVQLCLFGSDGQQACVDLPEVTGGVWHGYLPSVSPGQRYGFRVFGPFDPERGHRCDASKLLLDPYARAIEGPLLWTDRVFSKGQPSALDSAADVPHAVVVNPYFCWGDDRRPRTPWHETIIYETHVRGMTMMHPGVPEHLRGTYAGLSHPAVIEYLKSLGVTAVELMPVHHFIDEQRLSNLGLRNYWGYNSIGYFAPHGPYSSSGQAGRQVAEFKNMVKTLHTAGIEVILDVVYNHTGEGGHEGPTLCWRGIDNAAYYRLSEHDRSLYVDYSGCGNTLNSRHPHVLQLIMDSLRYWVQEMHVDGFRFDLASALARELHAVDRLSAFFDIIQQDPIINRVKLIAEPWDVGQGGYQVGNFPALWSEWNGQYRDTVRDFWRGSERRLGEFAYRFTGSSDLYASARRAPHASVNFVTCHDGFTLHDLVSYEQKHNEANGEGSRDGTDDNRSWNCGVEGVSDDPHIRLLRRRQQFNLLSTLLLSQGVPMLLAGDEWGRTQQGNNNAYCQDNPLSWLNWEQQDRDVLQFARRLVAFRREHPVFRRRRWFEGVSIRGTGLTDIGWFSPEGDEMTDDCWQVSFVKALGIFLNGEGIPSRDRSGERLLDDDFYLIFSAAAEPLRFTLPKTLAKGPWLHVIDTSVGFCDPDARPHAPGDPIEVLPHGFHLFQRPRRAGGRHETALSAVR